MLGKWLLETFGSSDIVRTFQVHVHSWFRRTKFVLQNDCLVHHMGIVFYVFAQLYRIIEFHLFALFNALPIERWNVFYIIDLDYKLTTQFAETSTAQQ